MNFPGGWELVLVLLVVLVLFGAKRLPDSARALGRSMRILKAETKGLREDDASRSDATTVRAEPLPPVAPPPPPGQQPYSQQPYSQQPYGQPGHEQQQAQPGYGSPQGGTPSGDQAQQPRP